MIAITVPFYKQLPSKTAKCLLDLTCLLPGYGYGFTFISVDNTYLHGARESLWERFEKERKARESKKPWWKRKTPEEIEANDSIAPVTRPNLMTYMYSKLMLPAYLQNQQNTYKYIHRLNR